MGEKRGNMKRCIVCNEESDLSVGRIPDGLLCSEGHFVCSQDFSEYLESISEFNIADLEAFASIEGRIFCPKTAVGECLADGYTDREMACAASDDAYGKLIESRQALFVYLRSPADTDLAFVTESNITFERFQFQELMEVRIKEELERRKNNEFEKRKKMLASCLVNIHCPNCNEECMKISDVKETVVYCKSGCNAYSCVYCQTLLRDYDHGFEHVFRCPEGLGPNPTQDEWVEIRHRLRTSRAILYLKQSIAMVHESEAEDIINIALPILEKMGIHLNTDCIVGNACADSPFPLLQKPGLHCSEGHFICSIDFARHCEEQLKTKNVEKIFCPLHSRVLRKEQDIATTCALSHPFTESEIARHTPAKLFNELIDCQFKLHTVGEVDIESEEHAMFDCIIGASCPVADLGLKDGILCSNGHFLCKFDFSRHCESASNMFSENNLSIHCPSPGCDHAYSFREIAENVISDKILMYVLDAHMTVNQLEYERYYFDRVHEAAKKEANRLLKRSKREKLILKVRDYISENILNLRCPSCHQVYVDFEGCACLKCASDADSSYGCKIMFCAYCNKNLGFDSAEAHNHVRTCDKGLKTIYPEEELNRVLAEHKRKALRKLFLHGVRNYNVGAEVCKMLRSQLDEIGFRFEQYFFKADFRWHDPDEDEAGAILRMEKVDWTQFGIGPKLAEEEETSTHPALNQLLYMGFPRDRAVAALRQTNDVLRDAVNLLL